MKDTVWIAPANQVRVRELVAEFQKLADERTALVNGHSYTPSDYNRLSLDIESVAYRLVGCLQGTALVKA